MTPEPSIAVSASPRTLSRLRGATDGWKRILHRGSDAIYVDLDGWCLGVVSAAANQVPCALRTRLSELPVPAGDGVYLRSGVVRIDETSLVVGRLHQASAPRFAPHPRRHRTTGSAPVTLPPVTRAGPVSRSFDALPFDALPFDALSAARQIGAGPGLTPLTDDILCGWLALHRAAGVATPEVDRAVRAHLHRTTLLSATLLDCALHGEVVPEFAAYVAALGTSTEDAAADALAGVGHTSGAGLLQGARWALTSLGEGQEAVA